MKNGVPINHIDSQKSSMKENQKDAVNSSRVMKRIRIRDDDNDVIEGNYDAHFDTFQPDANVVSLSQFQ